MTIDEMHRKGLLLFEAVSGSRVLCDGYTCRAIFLKHPQTSEISFRGLSLPETRFLTGVAREPENRGVFPFPTCSRKSSTA